MKQIHEFPLRKIKHARTRLALADAIMTRMRDKPLSQITVDVLCRDTEISRGTFFRYFPRKVDLIFYILKLWEIEIIWDVTHSDTSLRGLAAIEAVFFKTTEIIESHPHLFSEIIALRAFEPMEFEQMDVNRSVRIGETERIIRYPGLKGIESISEGGFPEFFHQHLITAIANRELPGDINIDEVNMSLSCIFYGVPLMSSTKTSQSLSDNFSRQIQLLWTALKAEAL